ncbi:hypothetical protein BJP36_18115 [Moorena producens JHB]|uniref:Uncharacterized protein n=1 Tax=Moorena producens (strain JHB) TaxID=1454205 RepID=A0A1D9G292_MOOP1|nr:hypothetical protein [Moorena producens]AOY81540.1 hypothetical protein BJP36_18115 [Moorena producens JHB]
MLNQISTLLVPVPLARFRHRLVAPPFTRLLVSIQQSAVRRQLILFKAPQVAMQSAKGEAVRSWGGRGATRGEFNYGSNAPLRSWGDSADLRGFPP